MTSEQKELLSLLKYFSVFCERYGLRYYLVGGTLLGAIRHKGFIPWDDDIDVAMPRKDYEKLLELRDSLKDGLVLLEESTCSDYPFCFCEVCNTNVPFEHGNKSGPPGIYIDIFPLDLSRKPDSISKFFFNIISVIGYVLQVKTGWTDFVPYKKIYARIAFDYLYKVPVKHLRKLRRCIVRILASDKGRYCFSPGGGHKGITEFYPIEWFASMDLVEFCGENYPTFAAWDQYLEQLYGDYMIPPNSSVQISKHKK